MTYAVDYWKDVFAEDISVTTRQSSDGIQAGSQYLERSAADTAISIRHHMHL